MSPSIRVSHRSIDSELRGAQAASVLAREETRERQRRGEPAPPPTRTVEIAEGSQVLSAGEWQAVMHLVETHPETKDLLP